MDQRRPPQTGLPIVDNLLAASWTLFAALNAIMSASVFADLMVGAGAFATLILTLLRIYEHMVGEPVSETLFEQ
jgi:hypothetical protein